MTNKFGKTFTAVAGVLLLGVLTACAPTVQPTAKPTDKVEVIEEKRACAEVSPDATFGDVAPLEERENENGVYCHVAFNPESIESSFNKEAVNQDLLKKAGFTEADLQQAHTHSVEFIAEETFDSVIVDSVTDGKEWFNTVGVENILPSSQPKITEMVEVEGKSPDGLGYIMTNRLPTLIYDGKPRISNMSIKFNKMEEQQTDVDGTNVTRIAFFYDVVVNFKAKNTEIVKNLLRLYPEQTESTLKADHPTLFEAGTIEFTFDGTVRHNRDASDPTKFSGFGIYGDVKTVDGVAVI